VSLWYYVCMKVNVGLTKVLKREHIGKWVALSEDQTRVVDFSENLIELTQRINSDQNVIYTRVLDPDHVYAF